MRVLFALLPACSDYALHAKSPGSTLPDTPGTEWELDTGLLSASAPPEDSGGDAVAGGHIDAAFNVAIQYSNFGATLGRCQIEVAFYEPATDDGTGGGHGDEIALPALPGTCSYTTFDPDEAVIEGSMNVRGTLEAGDFLALDDGDSVPLPAQEHTDGTVTYALAGCAREAFPFGRTFDVAAEGSAIPAFILDEAVAVGPDLGRTLPLEREIVAGRVTQSLSEPLEWGWERLHAMPETSAGPVVPREMFIVRHARREDDRLLETLACMPSDEHGVVISAADLALLSPTTDSTYAYGQIDAYSDGLAVEAPWGQLVKVRSLVSWSGELVLVSG